MADTEKAMEAIKAALEEISDIDPEEVNEDSTFDSLNLDSLDMCGGR